VKLALARGADVVAVDVKSDAELPQVYMAPFRYLVRSGPLQVAASITEFYYFSFDNYLLSKLLVNGTNKKTGSSF
jgi:hypothetical protein